MRHRLVVLVAVTSLLTVLSPAMSGPAHARPASPRTTGAAASEWARVQYLLFGASMSQFLAASRSPDPRLDWSTDGCSAPITGDTGLSFDFTAPCRRHDFGYRNLKLLDRRHGSGRFWNPANRWRVDERFLADMLAHCRTRAPWLQPRCRAWAQTYHTAVRWLGWI